VTKKIVAASVRESPNTAHLPVRQISRCSSWRSLRPAVLFLELNARHQQRL